MKKFTSIAVVGLAAAIGFTSVAIADATIYGRVTAGAVLVDNDKEDDDGSWDFGSNKPGLATRFGVKGEQDLGNGMSAGFQIERDVGADSLGKRHNLVYLSGGWGKLTLGNQNNPYMKARNWDQTYFYGGNWGHGSSYRHEGISYSMSNGPFSLTVQAIADSGPVTVSEGTTVHYYTTAPAGGATALTDASADPANHVPGAPRYSMVDGVGNPVSGTCSTIGATCAQGYTIDDADDPDLDGSSGPSARPAPSSLTRVGGREVDDSSGVDGWIFHAGYDFGIAAVNVAVQTNDTESTTGRDNTAIGFSGSVGALDWYLAHNSSELSNKADDAMDNDVTSTGGFLGFNMSDKDTVYAYHVAHSADMATGTGDKALGEDYTETILGYSRDMGPGLRFIAEYQSIDKDLPANTEGSDQSKLALAIRYVF